MPDLCSQNNGLISVLFQFKMSDRRDPRVDAYIETAQPFAQPILKNLRRLMLEASPLIKETIKWGFPNYEYKGILCNMASFKHHCSFGFWKANLMEDPMGILGKEQQAMGHLGKITALEDLPGDEILIQYIKQAIQLNEAGVKAPVAKEKSDKPALTMHPSFQAALSSNKKASSTFENFSPSNKKEYMEWVNEAKTEATRHKRIETALQWLEEGKVRNWKYL